MKVATQASGSFLAREGMRVICAPWYPCWMELEVVEIWVVVVAVSVVSPKVDRITGHTGFAPSTLFVSAEYKKWRKVQKDWQVLLCAAEKM